MPNDEKKNTRAKAPKVDASPYDATRDVIHRHLSDINDEITEEDIKNAYTGKSHPLEPDAELIKSEQKDIKQSIEDDKKNDEDDDNRLTVPPVNILTD
ncbi:MAG: hypothetical protein ABIQ56_07605 [Chitinophagaceae bacterium]